MAINIISFFILGANVVVGLVLIVVARFKPTWWHWELFLDWGGTAAISVTSVLVDDLVTAVNRYVYHCSGAPCTPAPRTAIILHIVAEGVHLHLHLLYRRFARLIASTTPCHIVYHTGHGVGVQGTTRA